MSLILQPIPTPSSSSWYEDFEAFNTHTPIIEPNTQNVAKLIPQSVEPNTYNDAEPVVSSIPEIPTSAPSINFKPIAPVVETRRSARQHVTPTWFKDYVSPSHVPIANQDFELCKAMNDELRALEVNETWEMTTLPPDKKAIEYHWIFKTKLKANGFMDRKKARLVLLMAVSAMKEWDFCQMDVSNAFLHGDLFEEVYEVSSWHESFSYKRTEKATSTSFHMKDLGDLSYFLGLEVCRNDQGIFISQKYTTDLLKEAGVLNEKPYKLPMDQHVKLQADTSTPLPDPKVYRRLIALSLLQISSKYGTNTLSKVNVDTDLVFIPYSG
ncbi:retrovirus-related pol polyprotein from transposon TNT 1-94 [Tanacetum coccineum]